MKNKTEENFFCLWQSNSSLSSQHKYFIEIMDTASATAKSSTLDDLRVLQKEATLSIIAECNSLVDVRAMTNKLFVARCDPHREQMVCLEKARAAESNVAHQSTKGKGSG